METSRTQWQTFEQFKETLTADSILEEVRNLRIALDQQGIKVRAWYIRGAGLIQVSFNLEPVARLRDWSKVRDFLQSKLEELK